MITFLVKQGLLLLQLRDQRGFSQRQLAISAKIALMTISRAEGSHTELQSGTAVRILKALNAHSPFTLEELAQIQESFGLSAGIFTRNVPQPAPVSDQSPAALTAAIVGIVGSDRATQILRSVLAQEAQRFKPQNSVSFTADPERGSDGRVYQVTKIEPTGKKATKADPKQKRKTS